MEVISDYYIYIYMKLTTDILTVIKYTEYMDYFWIAEMTFKLNLPYTFM